MSLTMDQPLLVAPRPVRVAAAARTRAHSHARDDLALADKPAASPHSSPRSPAFPALPSEALEEFLSILRPGSPRRPAPSLPLDSTLPRLLADDIVQPSRSCPDSIIDDQPADTDHSSVRWYKSNVLSSPISRTHTRNPFLRHALNRSPAMISPAAIPLPQPTPDEIVDMS